MAGLCSSRSYPSLLVMAVVEIEVVICEQAQPFVDKAQSLPNLNRLQVHRGKGLLKEMTSPAQGRAKNRNTLPSAVYF